MKLHGIHIPESDLRRFCARHDVIRLSLYGSILRDDFQSGSDIDVLIDLKPGIVPSLFDLGQMQQELCDLFGRQVDLKTAGLISDRILPSVQREARLLYAA